MFKAFQGDNLQELLAQIRREMGKDVLILQQRVQDHGANGLPQFEVLAMRGPQSKPKRVAGAGNQLLMKKMPEAGYTRPARPAGAVKRREMVSAETFVPPVLPLDFPAVQAEIPGVIRKRKMVPRRRSKTIDQKNLTYRQPSIPLEPRVSRPVHSEPVETVLSTVPDCAAQPRKLSPKRWTALSNYLLDQDIDREIAEKICAQLRKEFSESPEMGDSDLRSQLCQHLIDSIRVVRPAKKKKEGLKLLVMLGPTGVGKTTTAVKLAVKYALNEYYRVAFLTTDTSRLAAAEQLSRYADILRVPCHTAYDMDELRTAIESLRDHDIVIVDTAGCSPNDHERLSSLQRWLAALPVEQERFLVVSATTNRRDLYHITKRFSDLDYGQYIFTKLDESNCLGSVFNVLQRSQQPALYITNGQEISGHLEPLSPRKMVANILADYRGD